MCSQLREWPNQEFLDTNLASQVCIIGDGRKYLHIIIYDLVIRHSDCT